jgi:hypothetical protein
MVPVGVSALPRRPGLLTGETTASFLVRLAAMNGLSFGELMTRLGGPRQMPEPDVQREEAWLGPAARERLGLVTGRAVRLLDQTLPKLARSKITAAARRQVQVLTWAEGQGAVLACALCTAGRAEDPVWRVRSPVWEVCVRHGRWAGSRPGGEPVDVAGLPEVAAAHARRIRLERTAGPYGRALIADALQVASYWWQCRQMGSRGGCGGIGRGCSAWTDRRCGRYPWWSIRRR